MAGLFPPQHVDHPCRSRPAEYKKSGSDAFGWYPGCWHKDGELHNVHRHKKHYHFIWPKDGKNGTKWGRLKDIFSGEGPNIHVTVGAQKMDYMHHRQRRPIWGRHEDLDGRGQDCEIDNFWKDPTVEKDLCYDFRTRKFRRPYNGMWTDARWQVKPGIRDWPKAYRDNSGEWWQDPQYVPWQMHPQVFGPGFFGFGGNAD
jgi:hypothetical protein